MKKYEEEEEKTKKIHREEGEQINKGEQGKKSKQEMSANEVEKKIKKKDENSIQALRCKNFNLRDKAEVHILLDKESQLSYLLAFF